MLIMQQTELFVHAAGTLLVEVAMPKSDLSSF